MNTILITIALLVVLVLLAHAAWTLAYAFSPQRSVDRRLKVYVDRN